MAEMKEYAIVHDGQVVSIFTTCRPMDYEARAVYIGEIIPIEDAPADKVKEYKYWRGWWST